MEDAICGKVGAENGVEIISSPVSFESLNFSVKLGLEHGVELSEERTHRGLFFYEKNPGETCMIIHTTNFTLQI